MAEAARSATDPKEEYPEDTVRNSWALTPLLKLVADFERSVQHDPLIPMGTPDPYRPPSVQR